LRMEALAAERWNRLHPDEPPRKSHLEQALEGVEGPFVASSDYVRLVAEQVGRWVPGGLIALGTDGFGRSDNRQSLRRFFEVDAEAIAIASLKALADRGRMAPDLVRQAIGELGVDSAKPDPMSS